MKHVIAAVLTALLALSISTSALAHSHFERSIPADGDVVTEPLTEIVLEFNGRIEQGSIIDLTTTAGQEIELEDIHIRENTVTGTVATPLPNDDYLVHWSIISADGHLLDGEFSFTVDAPVSEPNDSESVVPVEPTESREEPTEDQVEAIPAEMQEERSSTSITILSLGLILVIVAFGLFFIKRKKR